MSRAIARAGTARRALARRADCPGANVGGSDALHLRDPFLRRAAQQLLETIRLQANSGTAPWPLMHDADRGAPPQLGSRPARRGTPHPLLFSLADARTAAPVARRDRRAPLHPS